MQNLYQNPISAVMAAGGDPSQLPKDHVQDDVRSHTRLFCWFIINIFFVYWNYKRFSLYFKSTLCRDICYLVQKNNFVCTFSHFSTLVLYNAVYILVDWHCLLYRFSLVLWFCGVVRRLLRGSVPGAQQVWSNFRDECLRQPGRPSYRQCLCQGKAYRCRPLYRVFLRCCCRGTFEVVFRGVARRSRMTWYLKDARGFR